MDEPKSLNSIFKEKLFRVPDYQRGYAVAGDYESGVEVVVSDDGTGVDGGAVAGVGWSAMRERAHEFGGTLHVDRRVPCGTRIVVDLPAVAT